MFARLLLVQAALMTAAPPVPAQQAPMLSEADSLLHARRYLGLEQWLDRPGARALSGAQLFQGVIDNRRNRNAASVARLVPLLTDKTVAADTARRRALLETLADDYGKLYRYADAVHTMELIESEFGATMPEHEHLGLEAGARLRRLLATAPAQRTTIGSAFDVPLRRNAIGLFEVPARVGTDSSWWTIDTGANFSTISESMARQLGLSVSAGSAATHGISGTLISLHVAVVPLLALGRADIANMVVLVLPDSALYIPQIHYQISAILGFPPLEALRVVTMSSNKLSVGLSAPIGAGAEMFLEQLSPLVAATVDGHTDLYHFDTGANRSVLTAHFHDAHRGLFAGLAPSDASMTGTDGTNNFLSYTLPDLIIALGAHTATLHGVTVFAGPTSAPFDAFYGNLGQDVIGGATLTLDFVRMKVILS